MLSSFKNIILLIQIQKKLLSLTSNTCSNFFLLNKTYVFFPHTRHIYLITDAHFNNEVSIMRTMAKIPLKLWLLNTRQFRKLLSNYFFRPYSPLLVDFIGSFTSISVKWCFFYHYKSKQIASFITLKYR